ncbi:amino acid ABC transporter permease (plasmid) [Bosea sp. F3-2]|uniref:amino acid ABC transporter permease n=1 Tax=Bosea sp. F3-2 TaxID=2599640 RepID=UPI0011ED89EB|nr:amino acid ABC transporter permease [Bosea sp. F3-2]QEL27044.1 amino acid ABC transporter permease [Bosea sp. F3-2]
MTYQFDFSALLPYWEQLLRGCWLTILLSAISISAGLAIGILTALAKQSRFAAARIAASTYVEAIRNTPFLVQVFFIFFGLPALGISFQPWSAAILALSLNCGAFSAEVIRGGIDAIARGQYEAGTALGLKPLQIFRHIILKPALRIIFPALSGQFVLTLLTTSIVSSISAEELTSIAQSIDTLTFRSFEIYIVATILYLTMSFGFATLFKLIDRVYFSYPVK